MLALVLKSIETKMLFGSNENLCSKVSWRMEQEQDIILDKVDILDRDEENYINSKLTFRDHLVVDKVFKSGDFLVEFDKPPMAPRYYKGQVTEDDDPVLLNISDHHDQLKYDNKKRIQPKSSAPISSTHIVSACNNASPGGIGVQVNDDENGYEQYSAKIANSCKEKEDTTKTYKRKTEQTVNTKSRKPRNKELTREEKQAEIIINLANDQVLYDYCRSRDSNIKKPIVEKLRTTVIYMVYVLDGTIKKKCPGLFDNPPEWWPPYEPYVNPHQKFTKRDNLGKPDKRAHQDDLISMLRCCYDRMMVCFPNFDQEILEEKRTGHLAAAAEARRLQEQEPDAIAKAATEFTAAKRCKTASCTLLLSASAVAPLLSLTVAQLNDQQKSLSPAHRHASDSSMDCSTQDSFGFCSGSPSTMSSSSAATDWSNTTSPTTSIVIASPVVNTTEEVSIGRLAYVFICTSTCVANTGNTVI